MSAKKNKAVTPRIASPVKMQRTQLIGKVVRSLARDG